MPTPRPQRLSTMPLTISKTRELVVGLREALLKQGPLAIEHSLPALEAAVVNLQRIQMELAEGKPASFERAELVALRSELRRVVRLIEHGASLWEGWARMLGAALGYTASGDPAPLDATGRLSVRG